MRKILFTAIAMLWCAPSFAEEPQEQILLQCALEKGEVFSIELWKDSEFGEKLHCVNGGRNDFELVPCAPDGGCGLSWKSLEAVTLAWQEAVDHQGGVFFCDSPANRIRGRRKIGWHRYPSRRTN